MARYKRSEAREWGREMLNGVANVTIPTMKSDFETLNEKAIRHDVELSIGHGFIGSLACSEVAITLDQYGQFLSVMADQAAGRSIIVHHAVFNSLEQNLRALKMAEEGGAELVLLSYPPYFYPKDYEEVYEYTRTMCDATDLAVMLFQLPAWGFQRLHPSDIPVSLLRRLVDDCPNVAGIKAEGGTPHFMSMIEVHRHFHKEVVVSCPLDFEYVPLAQVMPIQFSGTNYTSLYGPTIPNIHKLIAAGEYDEATRIWYEIEPARKAFLAQGVAAHGLINRMMWKYEGWLQGYNGGPMPHPTMRVHSHSMKALRQGMIASNLNPTQDPDEAFFIGRNPE
ncbi:dihydrodipicolinate synthase family protein [Novosphingobium sp.]|uniref:dihydrodipicolinate synthase family protein n=1 Tax=Novosphingobium sp. TaxID=1874826 RepID=UPI0035654FEE